MRHGRGRTALAASVAAGLLALAGCGDDSDAGSDRSASGGGGGGGGTVAVRLEPVEGIFIEGFEIGLRFSDADGNEIDRVLWTEYVESLGGSDPDAFYTSVLEQPVPAGQVIVEAQVSIGIGPGPVPPDLDAEELPCRLPVDVPGGGEVTVEVAFTDSDCLTKVS